MKIVLHEGNQYVLRFDRGEELMESLKQFCLQEKILSAFFQGLGACSYLKVASYNLDTKQYETQEFNQALEIINVTGNISMMNGEMIIHMHGTFSDEAMHALGGHVVALKVSGTCEIHLTKFETPMGRKSDSDTGLKLLE